MSPGAVKTELGSRVRHRTSRYMINRGAGRRSMMFTSCPLLSVNPEPVLWRTPHLISWAGLCPRNDESAGKRRSSPLRKGATWLKTTQVQCAWAASRKKASYLQAQFQRLRHRRGPKTAICAVAASILTAVYHMLRDGTFYQDLGAEHFRRTSPEAQANRLARQIANLGYTCVLTPAAAEPVCV